MVQPIAHDDNGDEIIAEMPPPLTRRMVISSGTTSGRASTMANAAIVVPGELFIGYILHSHQLAPGTALTSILPSHPLGTTFDPPFNSASAASTPHHVVGAPERTLPAVQAARGAVATAELKIGRGARGLRRLPAQALHK